MNAAAANCLLKLLEELEDSGCIKKDDLWIMECEDHV